MATSEPVTGQVDPKVVQARAMRLAGGVVAPFYAMSRRILIGFAGSAVAGLAVGLAAREPAVGLAVGLGLSLVTAVVVWAPFADLEFRGAAELFYDHDCHERAEWKAETGTAMPRGLRAVKQWLLAHPASPGRASLLLVVGRLDEADRAMDAMEPKTPEEAFGLEILRRSRILLAGDTPDLAELHQSWRSLPDLKERRHRRECLALLDAQLAVDQGRDPIPVMAVGRQEIGEVYWTMRAPLLLAKWSSIALLAVGSATLLTVALVR